MLPKPTRFAILKERGFNIQFLSHAEAILEHDFPGALDELEMVLAELRLPITEIIGSGGGETKFTQRLRRQLAELGWAKHIFRVDKSIDGTVRESISHEVDHVKAYEGAGTIAMEIEWNNKDPFYDRDLENFKRLHAEGAISVGILVTRGDSLQESLYGAVYRFTQDRNIGSFEDLVGNGYEPTKKQQGNVMKRVTRPVKPLPFAEAWTSNFVSNKFGVATTHWDKLQARVSRGVGNPCPLLLIGLPASMVTHDDAKVEMLEESSPADEAPAEATQPPP